LKKSGKSRAASTPNPLYLDSLARVSKDAAS
jgi:hypothetical protein